MSLDPNIAKNAALLRQLIDEVANRGAPMMERLVVHARETLHKQAEKLDDKDARMALDRAARALSDNSRQLVSSFPQALRDGFAEILADKPKAVVETAPLKFNQLELMDDTQVQEKVETARSLQLAVMAVESELGEFNGLICTVLGLKQVQADRNPIRPEVFVLALRKTLSLPGVDPRTTQSWGHAMASELGQELRKLYDDLRMRLLAQGIEPAEFALVRSPQGATSALAAAASGDGLDTAHLTIDQLKRLLSGELGGAALAGGAVGGGALAASGGLSAGGSAQPNAVADAELRSNLAASMQVIDEARHIVKALERLGHTPAVAQELANERLELRSRAKGEGQVLGQEIANLIVTNVAADENLLRPVQQVVSRLEPALLRLALIDPRFFTDKQHPALVLLEDLVQRSFGFESDQAPGFHQFFDEVNQSVEALGTAEIDGTQPFRNELERLRGVWSREDQGFAEKQESAKQALIRAEQRNALATELADGILRRPDIRQIPDDVVNFVVGPWVQVLAHARLQPAAPGVPRVDYAALMEELFWSVQPERVGKDIGTLVRMIPRLLGGLRQGLQQIDFPQSEAEQFFDALIVLHELSLNPQKAAAAMHGANTGGLLSRSAPASVAPWLAPEEARDSGFMSDLQMEDDAGPQTDFAATEPYSMPLDMMDAQEEARDALSNLKVGDWVELFVLEQWTSAQLTWATPQGSMYLFSGRQGRTHSMTRRLLERMKQQQRIRMRGPVKIVDRALDSVAQIAMRNSVFMDIQDESAP